MRGSKDGSITVRIAGNLSANVIHRAKESGLTVDTYVEQLVFKDLMKDFKIRNGFSAGSVPAAIAVLKAIKPLNNQLKRHRPLAAIRKDVLDSMMSHMKATEDPGYGYACGYQLKHIDRCSAMTRDYLKRLSSPKRKTEAQILAEVQRVVTKLNTLNASCSEALIATDQRELLCEFIAIAAMKAGLKLRGDITESWRMW